jgi:hypothetical protein
MSRQRLECVELAPAFDPLRVPNALEHRIIEDNIHRSLPLVSALSSPTILSCPESLRLDVSIHLFFVSKFPKVSRVLEFNP